MKLQNYDYEGKKVFIGMDVHKKSYALAIYCDDMIVKKWTATSSPEGIAEQINKYFKGADVKTAYEAGFSGYKLHRVLSKNGINNIVVNPSSIEVKSNDRVKTDKRDARKIAEQLATKRLKGIYIPSESEENYRALTRGRAQIVKTRKRISNQIKMKLHYLGFQIPDNQKVTETFIFWIKQLKVSKEHKFVFDELIESWRGETERINRFNIELSKQAKNDPLHSIYESAPGVGIISSRTLSNELGDMSRFNNVRELFSSSGLTPSENSSGEHVRKGHISRQGNPFLRGLLVEIAWRAIREDNNLLTFYSRIAHNRGSKIAIVAVARKILGRLRKCLKDKTMWRDYDITAKTA